MPKLSVIVPIYNVEQYIHKCVASILSQTFADFELILVNDGSPDNCDKICDEYAIKDNRVKVIHKKNGGVSEARNVGLDAATGEYISFIDPDDWIDKNMYEQTLAYMADNDLDIVCFDVEEVRTSKSFVRYKYDNNKSFTSHEALYEILIDGIDNSPCNKIYKKYTWEGVRFPIGRRFEDVATIYKTFHNANNIGYMRQAYYHYFRREGSAIALSFDAQRRSENFIGYKERYEFAQVHCKEALDKCKMFAVKTALSAITAESAGCGKINVDNKKLLIDFINNIGEVKYLNGKNKVLLWGAKHCSIINTIYGKLSMWSKSFK